MALNNCNKVEKETLAHWMDLVFNRALSNSNIVTGFKAIRIWPLNLDRMQQKMGLSKIIYSIPFEKTIEHEIMEDDLSRGESMQDISILKRRVRRGFKGVLYLQNQLKLISSYNYTKDLSKHLKLFMSLM